MSAQVKVTSGFAASGDGRIYFQAAGSGPAIVFVHAGVSDRRMWDPQFEAFANDYQVIRFDLRGCGKSSKAQGSFSNRDDLAAVLAAMGVEKAVLVRCSMGGRPRSISRWCIRRQCADWCRSARASADRQIAAIIAAG